MPTISITGGAFFAVEWLAVAEATEVREGLNADLDMRVVLEVKFALAECEGVDVLDSWVRDATLHSRHAATHLQRFLSIGMKLEMTHFF